MGPKDAAIFPNCISIQRYLYGVGTYMQGGCQLFGHHVLSIRDFYTTLTSILFAKYMYHGVRKISLGKVLTK